MNPSPQPTRRLAGPITIGAIFLFGFTMLALLWQATRSSDPAPADLKFAVPARAFRVISLHLKSIELDRAVATINASNADIVLLQGVRTSEVERLGEALHMSRGRERSGDVFYPAQNFEGPATSYGNAIYSRFPLYEGRSIPNRGGSFGVWCVAVVDGAKIMVASTQLTDSSSQVLGTQDAANVRIKELDTLLRAHEELGRPPILISAAMRETNGSDRGLLARFGDSSFSEGEAVLIAPSWSMRRVDTPLGLCVDVTPH